MRVLDKADPKGFTQSFSSCNFLTSMEKYSKSAILKDEPTRLGASELTRRKYLSVEALI
jgi:hypothetical protein